jgi:hypothetical protein
MVEASNLLATDDLEHHDAEAVDVGFYGELSFHGVLWRHVAAVEKTTTSQVST